MPGLTAPKLLCVRRHEPEHFRRVRRVLLPKAWLRLALTGEAIEERSDASGTLWLDVARRDWCVDALAACGLDRGFMPALIEGTQPAGRLRTEYSHRWRMHRPPVIAGGASDNAAGAVALGAISDGDTFLSLGTSGVGMGDRRADAGARPGGRPPTPIAAEHPRLTRTHGPDHNQARAFEMAIHHPGSIPAAPTQRESR